MGHSAPSTVASTWPTLTTTTTLENLSVPSGPPSTSNIPSMPKSQVHRPPFKMLEIHHPTPVPFSSLVHSDWSSEEEWDRTKQEKREISKIIRKEQKKIVEEERKRKEEENALLCRSYVLDLLIDETNLPFTNPPAPALEEKEKTQEKQKRSCDRLLPPKSHIGGQL